MVSIMIFFSVDVDGYIIIYGEHVIGEHDVQISGCTSRPKRRFDTPRLRNTFCHYICQSCCAYRELLFPIGIPYLCR
jgi:hypothetical protein